MDYLENHLLSRLKNNPPAVKLSPEKIIPPLSVFEPENKPVIMQFSEDEIEELLKELII